MTGIRTFYTITAIVGSILLCSCGEKSGTSSGGDNYSGFVSLPSSKTHVTTSNDLPETQFQNHFVWDSYYHGGGIAIGDINNDGLPDLFFTNTVKQNVLYLNKGNMEFEDITEKAGVGGGNGVNWGATMADINGDGWLDIYVCKSDVVDDPEVKRNKCYINQGDGTFREMAKAMGIDNPGYSFQAAFFDYDLDNDLDLFIMNQPSNARQIRAKYWNHEAEFTNASTSDRLYRNDGQMHFTDVSEEAGVVSFSYGLGLKICDLNGDQWPDIYVASDYQWPDYVHINNHDGTFTNVVNTSFDHIANSSMGIDIGDINNDAMDDVFVLDMAGINHYRANTNLPALGTSMFESVVSKGYNYQYMHNVLELNMGNGRFSEIAYEANAAQTDWSWGTLMFDADNDGWLDLYITNGIKRDVRNSDFSAKFEMMVKSRMVPSDLLQVLDMIPSTPLPNVMLQNTGDLQFTDKSKEWHLADAGFSNGSAYGDLDGDGDLDIVVNNVDAPASVYENKADRTGRHYLQFVLKTSRSKRPVEGTRISLYTGGKILLSQYFHPVRSYMSSSEPLVHFGLGSIAAIDSAVFIWPDRNISVMYNPAIDTRHVVDQDGVTRVRRFHQKQITAHWLADTSVSIVPSFEHHENTYDDYADQPLLPYRISTMGPAIAVSDVDGDGDEDFFIGGALGQNSVLYLQQDDGTFTPAASQPWSGKNQSDVTGALFFDADGDTDPDLYVARGGSELPDGDQGYAHMLYLNDGRGKFSATSALPPITVSCGAIAAGDWDGDGDLDLFVGSRNTPKKYPYPGNSYFLQNDKGRFTDVTQTVCTDNPQLGMVTDALFADKDGDGDVDLLLCGEWMAPEWLINDGGKFSKADIPALAAATGWWNCIKLADINGDGFQDILAGNRGTNNKFPASQENPMIVLGGDFDHNNIIDIILASHYQGKEVPVRGREFLAEQLPYIATAFPTFDGFAKASLQDIVGGDRIGNALRLEATELRSGIFWGNANGDYTWEAFPVLAQIAPIMGFVITDVTGDNVAEVICAGNLFDTEVETTRYDAGKGLIMSYGSGKWITYSNQRTGFYASGNIRHVKPIRMGNTQGILFARSGGPLSLFVVPADQPDN